MKFYNTITFKRVATLMLSVILSVSLFGQVIKPVNWTFKTKSISNNEAELIFEATIDNEWHLYSTVLPPDGPIPTSFVFEKSSDYELKGSVLEPTPISEYDDLFEMDVKYFANNATFRQRIKLVSDNDFIVKGTYEYMVCNDETCVPFYDNDFSINVKGKIVDNAGSAAISTPILNTKIAEDEAVIEVVEEVPQEEATKSTKENEKEDVIVQAEQVLDDEGESSGSIWAFFIIALGLGFIGALTPCVYPMIPMTVSFFLNSSGSKAQGRMKALFYGVSIIFIYTVLGVLVSLIFGPNAIKSFADHWLTNLIFFLVFVLFAASFFGMFEIVLPSWIANRSDKQADKGGYIGVFFMAVTLVVVSISCTAPFVGGLLIEAASGELIKPIIGMFGFSLTFALPFTLFAFFPSLLKSMPKSGGWMNSLKVILAFLILSFGTKFFTVTNANLEWNIPREVFIAFWFVNFMLLTMYLLGKIKLPHDSDLPHIKIPRLFLALITFVFAMYLLPGMIGAPVKLISGFVPSESSFDLKAIIEENKGISQTVTASGISNMCDDPKYADIYKLPYGLQGYFDYEQGLACAKKLNKPLLLDFKSKACANCKVMEKNIWPDPEVLKRLSEEYVIVVLYGDQKTELPDNEWVISTIDGKEKKTAGKRNKDFQITKFESNAEPYYVLLGTDEKELVKPMGFTKSVDEYVDFLDAGIDAFKEQN